MRGDLLWVNGKIAVPAESRRSILREFHEAGGHFGAAKLVAVASKKFFWQELVTDCIRYVRSCATCQQVKADHTKLQGFLHALPPPKRNWEHVACDFFFDLPKNVHGRDGVLLVVDRKSKMVRLLPTKKGVTSEGFARLYLDGVYRQFGLPVSIVSDQDTRFDALFCIVCGTKPVKYKARRLCNACKCRPNNQKYNRKEGSLLQTAIRKKRYYYIILSINS